MPQIFVPPQSITGDQFVVEGEEAHHLLRVLRLKPQAQFEFFNGRGTKFKGEITSVSLESNYAQGRILQTYSSSPRLPKIVLFQGLPRPSKFDTVVEKGTELGVDEIVPFLSQKNPRRLSGTSGRAKQDRWRRITKAAAKQCGRAEIPLISPVIPFSDLQAKMRGSLSVLLWEKEKEMTLRDVFRRFTDFPTVIEVLVGPEAGLTDSEVCQLKGWGANTACFGNQILRTETMGLAVLAILQYELFSGDRIK